MRVDGGLAMITTIDPSSLLPPDYHYYHPLPTTDMWESLLFCVTFDSFIHCYHSVGKCEWHIDRVVTWILHNWKLILSGKEWPAIVCVYKWVTAGSSTEVSIQQWEHYSAIAFRSWHCSFLSSQHFTLHSPLLLWLHRKYKKAIEKKRIFHKILLLTAVRCRLRHTVTCMWFTCWETV